jgi:3-isopropylmalate/(R)-2-methylmalate dehydratase small subunit
MLPMEKLVSLTSTAIPLPAENMDTDRIIPARFLKATSRKGMGENLFRDLRFDAHGNPIPGFVLNNPDLSGAILLTGKNFGCGSSREHAAWALKDYGFRVIVSESFADIFRNNALNTGLLPVELKPAEMNQLFDRCRLHPSAVFSVDLEKQTFGTADGNCCFHFPIPVWKKQCLLRGLDDIEFLLSHKPDMIRYESTSLFYQLTQEIPW